MKRQAAACGECGAEVALGEFQLSSAVSECSLPKDPSPVLKAIKSYLFGTLGTRNLPLLHPPCCVAVWREFSEASDEGRISFLNPHG